MRKLLINSIKRRKASTILFIAAATLILIITPLSLLSLQEAQTQVESDVTHYARGSYDLLVRPDNKQTELEEKRGVVPENYLGVGQGGISLEQWENIKRNPDIDIAAPVASLGYFTGKRTNIGVLPIPEESTRYTMQYYTTDGVNRYPVGKEYIGIMLETPLPGEKFEVLINDINDLLNEFRETAPMFPFPPTYHLLVGIDPEAETALTDISFDRISPENPASGWGSTVLGDIVSDGNSADAVVVPVMQLLDGTVSLQAEIDVDKLGLDEEDVQHYRDQLGLNDELVVEGVQNYSFMNLLGTEEYNQLVEDLIAYPEEERNTIHVDLKEHLNPFEPEALVVDEKEEISVLEADGNLMETIDFNFASTYYTAGDIDYESAEETLIVRKVGEESGVPVYREVTQQGIEGLKAHEQGEDIDLIIDPVGSFETGEREEQLAASPLGIYRLEPVMFKGNADEVSFPMGSTITPGSFVPAPASGVTNIQAAAAVKGDQPIDAIRVKVGGISDYTLESVHKIEQIAQDIEAMGLHVSIVAGASHQLMDIDVEGVGLVEEAWTTLGAAGNIVDQWNVTNIVLAVLFLFVAFMYIFNRVLFWYANQRRDIILLQRLGWKNKHVKRFFTIEILILMVLSWFISVVGLYLVQLWLESSRYVFLWQLGLAGVAVLLLVYMMHRKLKQDYTSKRISKGERKRSVGSRFKQKSLAGKNMVFFRSYILPPFVQLLVVSALSSYVFLSLTETVQQTNLTALGQYINVQISDWHFLLIIAAYLLALFTLLESITSLLISRQQEIGYFRSLGWERIHIFKLYLKELSIWKGMAVFFGSVVSLIAYMSIYQIQVNSFIVVGASFAGVYISTIIVAALMLYRLLVKDVSDTLSLKRK